MAPAPAVDRAPPTQASPPPAPPAQEPAPSAPVQAPEAAPVIEAAPTPTPTAISDAASMWEAVRVAAQAKPALVPILGRLGAASFDDDCLRLRCASQVEGPARSRLEAIKGICTEVAGRPIRVELVIATPANSAPAPAPASDTGSQPTPAPARATDTPAPTRPAPAPESSAADTLPPPTPRTTPATPTDRDAVAEHPLVKEAMDLFDARIVDIMPAPPERPSAS